MHQIKIDLLIILNRKFTDLYKFRARFESCITELIQRCTQLIDQVLTANNLTRKSIDKVGVHDFMLLLYLIKILLLI